MEQSYIDSDEEAKRTLICKNIPISLLKRQNLKNHFEKFGTITKLLTNVEKGIACVEFSTHGEAANARKLGTNYHSHEILISWKKRLSRSSSSDGTKLEKSSNSITRSDLFSKAVSSATGDRTPNKVNPYSWTRGRVSGNNYASTHQKNFGLSSRSQIRPQESSSSRPVKREALDTGLYSDLPPPDDWNEDSISQKSDKNARLGNLQANKQRVPLKNPFGSPFSKRAGVKKEPFFSTEQSRLMKPHPFVKREKTGTNVQDTAAQPPSTQSGVGTSGQVLFGKPLSSHTTTANKTSIQGSSESSAHKGTVVLFGKKMCGGKVQSRLTQPEDAGDSEDVPTLFRNPSGRRSVSPKRSILNRLSPVPTARTAPNSPNHQTPDYAERRSPSAVPSALFQPQEDIDESSAGLEWIMPPSLAALGQTAAISCSERYALLDKREKLMRIGINKESDISKARATKGCCPDMCPERERYMREEQRRVHIYEMLPNTDSHPQINHRIAVKDYSRSSADQEEPLPLELRPTHVLTRTMEYLCNNIMDIGRDGSWADWYDFLWSRTRAIRKDITQQHLCSPEAAGLVERCVRFHIYCSARLVEENSMTFDPKINNDNLTKCLQTLKEMYTDMLKRGVVCESEAEFRAYFVLMNLNEGDTLREVQQLRAEVRNSQQIEFALSAYAALSEKNYVKFFKLIELTTFLNACILHRYFNQIRSDALKVILKAYGAPKGHASLPCRRLFSMLHFEDEAEGLAFLQHFGISRDSSMALSRESFIEPESALPFRRSPRLVERKLTTSLGEAVYGEALPAKSLIEPTSSFDEKGYFIGIIKPPKADPGETSELAKERHLLHLPPPEQIPRVVKDCTKLVINEELDKEVLIIVKESIEEERQSFEDSKIQLQLIILEVVAALSKEVALEALTEARNEKSAQEEAERQWLTMKLCREYIKDLIERVQEDECRAVATEVYREAQQEALERQRTKCANAVGKQLMYTHVVSLVEEIAKEVYKSDVIDRQAALDTAERDTQTILSRRWFEQWSAVYRKRTHIKKAMITFPGAPPILPLKRSKDFKLMRNTLQINKRSRLALLPPQSLSDELELSVHQRHLTLMVSNAPLNMSRVLTTALDGDTNDSDFMKLLLLHPEGSTAEGEQLTNWLTNKLSRGSVCEESPATVHGKLLSHYTVTIENQIGAISRRFGVCIRSCPTLSQSSSLKPSLFGANMALALLPFAEDPDSNYWRAFRKQLRLFLQSKPVIPAIPLLLLSPFTLPKETIQHEAGVYELLEQKLISHVRVDRLDNTIDYHHELPRGIEWLVNNRPKLPDVTLTELKSLLESFLTGSFYAKVYQDLASRQRRDVVHMDVQDLIGYFNETLGRLEELLCDPELACISWPVYEQKTGCLSTEECHYLLCERMRLPEFIQHECDDWQHTCADIKHYLDTVAVLYHAKSRYDWISSQHSGLPALYARVNSLLKQTESLFASRCERQFHKPPLLQPLRQNSPWLHIIVACVELLTSTINPLVFAMHKPYDHIEFAASLPIADSEVSYVETMTAAMQLALEETDDSSIDMKGSVHTSTSGAANTDVCEELNASRQFEEFLIAQLEGAGGATDESIVKELTRPKDDSSDSHSDLSSFILKECDDSKAFEMFLNDSLLET